VSLADREISTDTELLRRATQEGDEAAFQLLYRRHCAVVYRFAYRLLGAEAAAEDVAHDCFMALLRRPAAFDPRRASLRTYLLAAARNLAFKQFRRNGHELLLEEWPEEPVGPEGLDPLGQLLAEEAAGEVRRAVLRLPPLQREALILFEYEELSLAEVAQITGADMNTIKARLYRARQSLKRELTAYWQPAVVAGSVG
jgi:RNA polymerase sigma-70 factor (ECF subfamily)